MIWQTGTGRLCGHPSASVLRAVNDRRAHATYSDPHIQIVARVLEQKCRAFEAADCPRNWCVRHIAPRVILPAEREEASTGASFLLSRLVQRQEITAGGASRCYRSRMFSAVTSFRR
jgi:hypothetical protein